MSRLLVPTSTASPSTTSRRHTGRRIVGRLETVVGGAARLRVVLLLAGVLSLTSADMATVGATATQLKSSLHIGNTDIGLLVTVSSGIAVFTTLPFGMLADRVPRVRLLVASIVSWSAMMVAWAAAPTFLLLLVFRAGLGAALAGAAALVASLTGDLFEQFEQFEQGRIYGYILGGELLGGGFGLLVCGDVAVASTWRASLRTDRVADGALEALAPLLFGYVSTQLGGAGGGSGYGHPSAAQPHAAAGLDHTLLVMLAPLAVAGCCFCCWPGVPTRATSRSHWRPSVPSLPRQRPTRAARAGRSTGAARAPAAINQRSIHDRQS